MKHKKIMSIFATLCVIAVAYIFMFNSTMTAEDKLLRENIGALAADPIDEPTTEGGLTPQFIRENSISNN